MRRKLAVVLVLMLIAAIVAGCSSNQNAGTSQKVFTVEELAKYDGKNGNPAYIAANGVVYDVSNSKDFVNGVHKVCSAAVAGTDVTALMSKSPHQSGKDLNSLPKVGTLSK
ncbi:MAG TPA: cytochrome b5 domain-containing protein [Syntrophomonadaceae bacterium]|nr:cytochrome b5 domain-containing protein [Syntrophomonadaceae bacterium]